MYRYPYPHPAVATDVAIFTLRDGALAVLLIRRKGEPFEGAWALPGGFLKEDEDLDACAARELSEEAGLSAGVLQHFGNFSAPERDPRERVISVAYFALVSSDRVTPEAGSDAAEARWFAISSLPALAFDHTEIVQRALVALRSGLLTSDILLALLPARFTLSSLQEAFEAVSGEAADKRNFRKRIIGSGIVRESDEFERGSHRPARLYERAV